MRDPERCAFGIEAIFSLRGKRFVPARYVQWYGERPPLAHRVGTIIALEIEASEGTTSRVSVVACHPKRRRREVVDPSGIEPLTS